MAETLTLTTPQSVTTYIIDMLKLSWTGASIVVLLHDTQGDKYKASYSGQSATDLMVALNKANLTTNSLQKRILNQLVTDGKLPAGTVTGTPD